MDLLPAHVEQVPITGSNGQYRQTPFAEEAEYWKRRFELLAAATGQVMYECDLVAEKIIWNGNTEQVLGYHAEELDGALAQLFELVAPRDQDEVRQRMRIARQTRTNFVIQYALKHKAGHYIQVEDRGFVLPDEHGALVRITGILQDVTTRTQHELKARLEQTRLNSLLKISQCNPASFRELLDMALDEAIALSDSKLGYIYYYDEQTQEFTLHAWSKAAMAECSIPNPPTLYQLSKTGIWGEAVRQRRPIVANDFAAPNPYKKGYPEGHAQLYKYMTLPIFSGNQIVAVVGVANKETDYTDFDVQQLALMMDSVWRIAAGKQAEEALRVSEGKFRAFIEENSEGMVLIDEQGLVIEWNRAMENISGLAHEDVIGWPSWQVQLTLSVPEERTPERSEQLKQVILDGLRTGESPSFERPQEEMVYRPDGSCLFIQQVIFPIKTDLGFRIGVVTRDVTDRIRAEGRIQALNKELLVAYDATLEGWSRALDLRDHETEGHSQRVTTMTVQLARAMGLSESEIVHIRRGALLHDIGKIGVSDDILLKPGPLTSAEWMMMRKHPQNAYDMLSGIAFLKPALIIPYCHHEKWDGTGYPRGLSKNDIPLAARIFTVIDVWDALTTDRPYRRRWPKQTVLTYLQAQRGKHFDPEVLDAFEKHMVPQIMDEPVLRDSNR
ncbi:MAG: HD domain-containing phosphohydrolase [Anaerolineae bacterium]